MARFAKCGFTSSRSSTEHGFTSSCRSAEHGFTLIEMMVALVIFALLSAAGIFLLSGSVGAQGAVQARLDGLAEIQRTASLLTADFAQAVPRVSRAESGALAPAFFAAGGGQGDPAVQFVRTGRDNPDGLARSALQKLEYGVVDGQLIRRSYPQVDGSVADPPAVLVERVSAAAFRFRGPDGAWRDDWRPTDPAALPRAVELTLAKGNAPPVRLLFLVGTDPVVGAADSTSAPSASTPPPSAAPPPPGAPRG